MKLLRTIQRFIREIAQASPRRAVLSMVLTAAMSFTEGMGLLLLMPLLQLVGVQEVNTLPNVTGWFVWFLDLIHVGPSLGGVLVLYVFITGTRTLLQKWQGELSSSVREEYTEQLRARIYRAITSTQWSFIVTKRPSDLTHVLVAEVTQLGNAAYHVADLLVMSAVSVVYVGLAFHLSPAMASLVVGSAAVLGWVVRDSLSQARSMGGSAQRTRKRLAAAVAEHIGSLKTTRVYGAGDRHERAFGRLSREIRDLSVRISSGETDLQSMLEFGSVAFLALIVFVALEVLHEPTASLLVLLFTFARLMPRLTAIYRRLQIVAAVLPALDDVTRFEAECLAHAEAVDPATAAVPFRRAVTFDAVHFTYPGREDAPAIADVSFSIPAGRTTAIVGTSGAGKSTLVDLLIGLLLPTSGTIRVDGVRLDASNLVSWRQQIGFVPQDTFLFHDTVRANLAWARPDATDHDIWEALRLAAADDFVRQLPQGLDTQVGERGVTASGGERQRLSLARALLRTPSVLILDEATSSLDSETEQRVRLAVEGLQHSMTMVAITHRLSTIAAADLIHVIDSGRLVESGTWESLLAERGRFAALCAAQGIVARPPLASRPVRPSAAPEASHV
ncbi:MAG: ABC transporter ATP-binding protein [Vicinamibacterales bacterium]